MKNFNKKIILFIVILIFSVITPITLAESEERIDLEPIPVFQLDWVTVYHCTNTSESHKLVNKKKHLYALFKKGYRTNLKNTRP